MRTLRLMVIKQFLPVFLISATFFILILQLIELFANLVHYLNQGTTLTDVIMVQVLYLPQCLTFSLPIAVLFSSAFTLGTFYSNNELISVFASGISLYRFIIPLITIGLLLSIFGFFFQEYVAIDSLREKNQLSRELLRQQRNFSNTNVAIMSPDGRKIYHADYFNSDNNSLSGVTIIQKTDKGSLLMRIDAQWASWKDRRWLFHNARIFLWEDGEMTEERRSLYSSDRFTLPPSNFRRTTGKIEEMRLDEAIEWIESLRAAGLPYRAAVSDFYERFTFSLTPFIMIIISAPIGGRLKKNILLMSLLISLVIAVIYYVSQMLTDLLTEFGLLAPIVGAMLPAVVFFLLGIILLSTSRT